MSKKIINKKNNQINKKIIIDDSNNDNINKKKVNKPNYKKVLRKCIEKNHFEFLINEIKKRESNETIKFNMLLLNTILYYTGLRLSEGLILNRLNYIELFEKEKFYAYCKKTKTYKWIKIMKNKQIDFLKIFDVEYDDRQTFFNKISLNGVVNCWDKPINIRTAHKWMEPYWKIMEDNFGGSVSGVAGSAWGFHSYRINTINQAITIGGIRAGMIVAGHKNISSTERYFRQFAHDENTLNNIYSKMNL